MQKYVDAAYAEASIRIASEKLNESKRMLAKMKRLYELGEKGRPDVVQMESQVAEDEYNLTHQENVAKQSLLALKSAMNFPVDEELKILIKEEQNLKLTSDNKEVSGFGVNYETVYPRVKRPNARGENAGRAYSFFRRRITTAAYSRYTSARCGQQSTAPAKHSPART